MKRRARRIWAARRSVGVGARVRTAVLVPKMEVGSGVGAEIRAAGAGEDSSVGEGGVEVGRAATVVVGLDEVGFAGGKRSKSSS